MLPKPLIHSLSLQFKTSLFLSLPSSIPFLSSPALRLAFSLSPLLYSLHPSPHLSFPLSFLFSIPPTQLVYFILVKKIPDDFFFLEVRGKKPAAGHCNEVL